MLAPYPQFVSVTENNISSGESWYNSLQSKLQQRFKFGLSYLLSYTWSKTMETTDYLNPQDAMKFNAVDLWGNLQGPAKVYGDPQVQAAFGTVFSGPPTVTPYQHSSWYQY